MRDLPDRITGRVMVVEVIIDTWEPKTVFNRVDVPPHQQRRQLPYLGQVTPVDPTIIISPIPNNSTLCAQALIHTHSR